MPNMPTATLGKLVYYQENTQELKVFGVKDVDTGVFWNSAAISATMVDENGADVPGCIDVNCIYQPGSNGDYIGIFGDQNFTPPVGTGYRMIIDGDQGPVHIHFEKVVEIRVRES